MSKTGGMEDHVRTILDGALGCLSRCWDSGQIQKGKKGPAATVSGPHIQLSATHGPGCSPSYNSLISEVGSKGEVASLKGDGLCT